MEHPSSQDIISESVNISSNSFIKANYKIATKHTELLKGVWVWMIDQWRKGEQGGRNLEDKKKKIDTKQDILAGYITLGPDILAGHAVSIRAPGKMSGVFSQ